MAIFIDRAGKRFNPYATHIVNDVTYAGNILQFPDAVAFLGVREIDESPFVSVPEDFSEHPEYYYVQETEDVPYVVYTRKSEEQISQLIADKAILTAREYLDSTDYLFTADRYAELTETEPDRAVEVSNKRAEARETIRKLTN